MIKNTIFLVFAAILILAGCTQPAPQECSFAGKWNTTYGEMVLEQKGESVTGRYEHDQGRINGIAKGSTLTGTWSELPSYQPSDDAGDIVVNLDDCNSWSGKWRYGSTGAFTGTSGWTAKRIQ